MGGSTGASPTHVEPYLLIRLGVKERFLPDNSRHGISTRQAGSNSRCPGCTAALEASGEASFEYLVRHMRGDWGEVDAQDAKENDLSVERGFRILSAYSLKNGVTIWIITEADRSSTCILLPEEY